MRAVDTNVLVRLIARDDLRQTAAAVSFIENGAWVPILALAEAIRVLARVYKLSAEAQAGTLEVLLNHRDLVLQNHETIAAALDLFRAKPGLGFTDCLMIESARRAGHIPMGTFDRNLAKVDGAEKL